MEIHPAVPELNLADGQTDMTSPICVHFLHTIQRIRNNGVTPLII
jgi:hypothetical protein